MGAFVGGLKSELTTEVRVYRPKTYLEAAEIAHLRDNHLLASKKGKGPEIRKISFNSGDFRSESKEAEVVSIGKVDKVESKAELSGVKRLPWDEMQRRREKGLCFNCDERFVPGHRCKSAQAFLIEPVELDHEGGNDAEVSLHAITGENGPRPMKLVASV